MTFQRLIISLLPEDHPLERTRIDRILRSDPDNEARVQHTMASWLEELLVTRTERKGKDQLNIYMVGAPNLSGIRARDEDAEEDVGFYESAFHLDLEQWYMEAHGTAPESTFGLRVPDVLLFAQTFVGQDQYNLANCTALSQVSARRVSSNDQNASNDAESTTTAGKSELKRSASDVPEEAALRSVKRPASLTSVERKLGDKKTKERIFILPSIVGEMKKLKTPLEYVICQGLGYLCELNDVCGTWMAFLVRGHSYAIVYAASPNDFVVVDPTLAIDEVKMPITIDEYLSTTRSLPQHFGSEQEPDTSGFERIWRLFHAGVQLLAAQRMRQPLTKLPPPRSSVWSAIGNFVVGPMNNEAARRRIIEVVRGKSKKKARNKNEVAQFSDDDPDDDDAGDSSGADGRDSDEKGGRKGGRSGRGGRGKRGGRSGGGGRGGRSGGDHREGDNHGALDGTAGQSAGETRRGIAKQDINWNDRERKQSGRTRAGPDGHEDYNTSSSSGNSDNKNPLTPDASLILPDMRPFSAQLPKVVESEATESSSTLFPAPPSPKFEHERISMLLPSGFRTDDFADDDEVAYPTDLESVETEDDEEREKAEEEAEYFFATRGVLRKRGVRITRVGRQVFDMMHAEAVEWARNQAIGD